MFTLLGWSRYVHATGVVSVCSANSFVTYLTVYVTLIFVYWLI